MRSARLLKFVVCLLCTLIVTTAALAQEYQIVRAEYGAGRRWVDVTGQLQSIASSNSTFRMGNSTFGVDPAPGIVKSLRIFARDGRGREWRFEYREGSTVDGSMFAGWGGNHFGGGDYDADAGALEPRLGDGLVGRRHGELGVEIHPLGFLPLEVLQRIEALDLAGEADLQPAGIELRNGRRPRQRAPSDLSTRRQSLRPGSTRPRAWHPRGG